MRICDRCKGENGIVKHTLITKFDSEIDLCEDCHTLVMDIIYNNVSKQSERIQEKTKKDRRKTSSSSSRIVDEILAENVRS